MAKSAPAAPGTVTAGKGKTAVRSTMAPVFGKGKGKRSMKRGGRSR